MACPPFPVGAAAEATFDWQKLFPQGYHFRRMEEELLRHYLKDWRKQLLPPGYRFRPTEEELVCHYLKRKIDNEPVPLAEISEVKLYHHNPQTLAERYPPTEDNGWFFFTPRERKYKNGLRPNRAAGTGYWKATGKDKPIEATIGTDKGAIVGYKKSLVFYQGTARNGVKTHWIMHEYTLNRPRGNRRGSEDMKLDDWVLCRIYENVDKSKDKKNQRQKDHENISPSSATACDESESSDQEDEVNDGDDCEESDPLVDNKTNLDQVLMIEDQKNIMGLENNSNYTNDPVMINNMSSYDHGYYALQTQSPNVVIVANYDQVPQFPVPLTKMDIDQQYPLISNTNVRFEGNDNEATLDYGFNQQEFYSFVQPEDYVKTGINCVNYDCEDNGPNIEGCSAGCSDVQVQKVPNQSTTIVGASHNDAAKNNHSDYWRPLSWSVW